MTDSFDGSSGRRWLGITLMVGILGCPAEGPVPPSDPSASPAPPPSAGHSTAAASRPASHPTSSPQFPGRDDFKVPEVPPKAPLAGPKAVLGDGWAAPEAGERCRYRLREVMNETANGAPQVGHQLVVTYEVEAQAGPDDAIVYTATVRHIRALGRNETYNTKVDSGHPGDMRRITGGADTTILFDVVVPFALLDRPIKVTMGPKGELRKIEGADAVRDALMQLHPPKPRQSPHYRGVVATRLDDQRLAAYLLPMVGLTPAEAPQRGVRDDVQYAVERLTNARRRVAGASVLWELKEAFRPAKAESKVPPLEGGPTVALRVGRRSVTVEQESGRACFRQAGLEDNRQLQWTGIVDEEQVTLDRSAVRTRLWVRDDG